MQSMIKHINIFIVKPKNLWTEYDLQLGYFN